MQYWRSCQTLSSTEEKVLGLDSVDSVPYIRAKLAEKTNRVSRNHTGFLKNIRPCCCIFHLPLIAYGRSGDRIPVGARFSAPVQTGPGAHPASCAMRTGSFLGVNSGRGVTLTPHPLLVLWSRKSRAIPLLPLWAVRPVQNLSACTRMHFTLPYWTPTVKFIHDFNNRGQKIVIFSTCTQKMQVHLAKFILTELLRLLAINI